MILLLKKSINNIIKCHCCCHPLSLLDQNENILLDQRENSLSIINTGYLIITIIIIIIIIIIRQQKITAIYSIIITTTG